MKIFKKKLEKRVSESKRLENLAVEEFKKVDLPVNQGDRLRSIYYKEFQKQNYNLYKSDPVEFWRQASNYVENKLRSYKSEL